MSSMAEYDHFRLGQIKLHNSFTHRHLTQARGRLGDDGRRVVLMQLVFVLGGGEDIG